MKLDVITMFLNSTPKTLVDCSVHSVKVAAERAGYTINIIHSQGVLGHIGKAMLRSLEASTADYVAWVDDDDYVLPNAFSCLKDGLATKPLAVCAREIRLLNSGQVLPVDVRHHLTAFSKDILPLDACRENRSYPLVSLFTGPLGMNVTDNIVDVQAWVYIYRQRISEGYKLRQKYKYG